MSDAGSNSDSDSEGGLDGMGVFELTEAEVREYAEEGEVIAAETAAHAEDSNELLADRRRGFHSVPVVEQTRVQRDYPVKTKWQGKFKTPSALQGLPCKGAKCCCNTQH